MKKRVRCKRILILSLLSISVFAPIVLYSIFTSSFAVHKGVVEDLSTIKYKTDILQNSVQQEIEKGLKEPTLALYENGTFESDENLEYKDKNGTFDNAGGIDGDGSEKNQTIKQENVYLLSGEKTSIEERQKKSIVQYDSGTDGFFIIVVGNWVLHSQGQSNQTIVGEGNVQSHFLRVSDEKVREMKDQVIRGKAYLKFASQQKNSQLVKELKLRIREVERALGEASKDSDLSRSALQRMRSMEAALSKANLIYTDCSDMVAKLWTMTYNTEEELRAQTNQANYLVQIAGRTTPKGLHCLSLRLVADYFDLQPEERELPNQHKLHDPDLYHYVFFSDNILAAAAVVNSTVSTSMEPEKIVFHLVTDAFNFLALRMWFLLNPPGQATIQIESMDNFESLFSNLLLKKQDSVDPRYTSPLNHLRFYLPEIFPALNKIVFLDHDVVVQRDLRGLWNVNMKSKVNGAVETCRKDHLSFRRMDMLINFTDPIIVKNFDAKACTWAFGMNVFDLREWRRQNLTAVYHQYLELGKGRQLWKKGSLPLGQLTFYNQTVALDRRWHALGLGYESGVGRVEIERAAVIHYDGNMKPWLEIGIAKYKPYWNKYIKYDHPYLELCNIHA